MFFQCHVVKKIFQNLRMRLKFRIRKAMKIKIFVACEIQYFEIGIFSFNSYVYYLTCGFIASTQAFNPLTRAFNTPVRAFNLLTRAFNLLTHTFNLPTRAFNLATPAFNLATCAFSLLTRGFDIVTR